MTELDAPQCARRDLLTTSLLAAVPLWIHRMRDWSPEERCRRSPELADHVAAHGDILQFKSKKRGETAEAFNRLAEGVAILAHQPGGVTVFGLHWCVGSCHMGIEHAPGPCIAETQRESHDAAIAPELPSGPLTLVVREESL